MNLADLRIAYHEKICTKIIRIQHRDQNFGDYPNFADGNSKSSVEIAWGIVRQLTEELNFDILKGQTAGGRFEVITKEFLEDLLNS